MALIAFAANSVLCRLALGNETIDPTGFTGIRMLSGAITLAFIVWFTSNTRSQKKFTHEKLALRQTYSLANVKGWLASAMLFGYAAFFSFAYVKLNTATGALILFASVQFFMIGVSLLQGAQLQFKEWLGVIISLVGFVILMLPSATQPSITGFMLMVISGAFWAFYSLLGRNTKQAILLTAENFIRCIPLAFFFLLYSVSAYNLSWEGASYAIASGAFASGVGYSIWYIALKNLTITLAAISQLCVPLIAALGGVLFVNESLTNDLIISGVLILIGILLVSVKKAK